MNERTARWLVPLGIATGVVALWVLSSLSLLGLRYWSSHDESVYVAKALGGRDPFIWRSHRAIGVPILLSPASGMGLGVTASRLSILFFNAAVAGLGLWLWIRLLGKWVVIGPATVLLSWLGVHHASALLPNLPTAVTLFATIPALWLAVSEPKRWEIGTALAGFLLIGLIRPTALPWVTVGIMAAVALDSQVRRYARRLTVFLAVALPLALLTWTIESFVTFGITPLERIRAGGSAIANYEHDNVPLTLLGNLAHPFGDHRMSLVILSMTLGAAAILTAIAFKSLSANGRGVLTIATCVGVAKIVAYVIFPSDGSARFLIAGLLSASVGAGIGLRSLVNRQAAGVVAVGTLLSFALFWQLSVSHDHAQAVLRSRGSIAAAATHMRAISNGETCRYESNVSFPSFYLGTSCDGGRAVDPEDSMVRMEGRTESAHSFLIWRGDIDPRPGWIVVELATDARWRLYHYVHVPRR